MHSRWFGTACVVLAATLLLAPPHAALAEEVDPAPIEHVETEPEEKQDKESVPVEQSAAVAEVGPEQKAPAEGGPEPAVPQEPSPAGDSQVEPEPAAPPHEEALTPQTQSAEDRLASDHAEDLQDGTYLIRSVISETKVLDVSGGSSVSGANVQSYESNMTAAQRWRVTHDEKGYVTLHAQTSQESDQVLDVQYGSSESGANVQQYVSNGTAAQKWILVREGGFYRILTALDPGLALDVAGASASNGANVQIYQANGTAAQLFEFLSSKVSGLRRGGSSELKDYEGYYVIKSSGDDDLALDISGGSVQSGANVQMYTRNGTLAQAFEIRKCAGGYQVTNAGIGTALDVDGGNLVSTTNVQSWAASESGNNPNQLFDIVANADGSLSFRSLANGLMLEVAGGRPAVGANVWTFRSSGSVSQRFFLERLPGLIEDGIYEIAPAVNESSRLDVSGGSRANGANVQIYSANGTQAQKWDFVLMDDGSYTIQCVGSGKYLTASEGNVVQSGEEGMASRWKVSFFHKMACFLNVATGGVMDVARASPQNCTNVGTWRENGTVAQQFLLHVTEPLARGYYSVMFADNQSQVLDVRNGSYSSGAEVQAYLANGTDAQKWLFSRQDDGSYVVSNAGSRKLLEVSGGIAEDGACLQQGDSNGGKSQRWHLVYNRNGTFSLSPVESAELVLSRDSQSSRIVLDGSSSASAYRLMFTRLSDPGCQPSSEANWLQLRVRNAALTTSTTPLGWCAAWVSEVIENAGLGSFDGNASDMYKNYCSYSELDDLKVGMIVAVKSHGHSNAGSQYGHVGIYIGDGKVMDSIGWVRTSDIFQWASYYGDRVRPMWGWLGGRVLA